MDEERLAALRSMKLHGPAKAGEQMRSVLDGSKLREMAGLDEPTALGAGLRRTMEWIASRAE